MVIRDKSKILEAINKGDNNKEQFQQFQYKKFDENWIVDIASFLPSVDRITRDLRSNLKYEEEVLPVEKTRRVNSESIRHLLRNTRYIKDIEDNGGIIPSKVLNSLSEIDYGIYENRFIMTLIERLNNYLSNRLDIIKENLHGFRETYYKFKNEFHFFGAKFGLNINMIAIEDFNLEELDLHNHLIYERTLEVFNIVSKMYNSEFMKTMKRYQRVKPPIMKTQIILKNPDFRNAYLLWLYLDRVHVLDFTLESETRRKEISLNYSNDLNNKISELLQTIILNTNFGNKSNIDETVERITTRPIKIEDEYVGNLNLDDVHILDLEPTLASEFYLDKAIEQFHENYKRITKRATSKENSIKQVLLDQFSIADQVFEHYFNTNQDSDVFEQLMKHRDPVKRYYEAYEKHKITKIALDVKERIYNQALELEKRWRLELNNLEIEAKAEIRRRETEADLKFDKLKSNIEQSKLEGIENQHKKLRKANTQLVEDISLEELELVQETIVSEEEKLNEKYNEAMSNFELSESEKIKLHYQNELEKLKESEEQRLIEELNARLEQTSDTEDLDKIKRQYQAAIIKIKHETNAKINELSRSLKK